MLDFKRTMSGREYQATRGCGFPVTEQVSVTGCACEAVRVRLGVQFCICTGTESKNKEHFVTAMTSAYCRVKNKNLIDRGIAALEVLGEYSVSST